MSERVVDVVSGGHCREKVGRGKSGSGRLLAAAPDKHAHGIYFRYSILLKLIT